MARMLSQVASIIRGSVGGITYTKNQYHAIIMRARVAPVDPATNNQSLIRSAMSEATASWEQLLQSVRDAWDLWASHITFNGPLGPYYVPGRILFTSAKALQTYIDERGLETITPVTSAPVNDGLAKLANVIVTDGTIAETSVAVKFANADLDDLCVIAEISPSLQQTRNFWKGPWDSDSMVADIVAAGAAGGFEFTDLEPGKKYFIRVKAVTNDSSPRFSPEYIVNQIAQTWS